MTASLRRGNRFASDSPFEGEGFELRVPLARKVASRGGEGAGGRSRWSRKACSFSRGTRGSSPSPSSKESATNLTGKNEPALARNRRFESVSLRHLPTQKENLAGGVAGDAPHVTAKFRLNIRHRSRAIAAESRARLRALSLCTCPACPSWASGWTSLSALRGFPPPWLPSLPVWLLLGGRRR